MNKKLILLTLSIVGIFVSCKKDKTDTVTPPVTSKTCLIQKIVYSDGANDTYTYNAANKLIKSIQVQDTNVSENNYTYEGNKVIQTISGIPMPVGTTYLNANGFADSSTFGFPGIFEMNTVKTYNSNGLMISKTVKSTQMGNTVTELTTYEYTGANITKEIYKVGPTTITTNFEYYLDKVDQGKKSYDAIFFENGNANLLKKQTDDTGEVTNYSYEFDADGKVTKRTRTITGPNPGTYSNTYTWGCK